MSTRTMRWMALLAIVSVAVVAVLVAWQSDPPAAPGVASAASGAMAPSAPAPRPSPSAPSASVASPAGPPASASARPSATAPGATRTPKSASAAPSPGTSTPAASATPRPAPSSAAGFQPRRTVVPIGFPLPASATYRYGDAWRVPRLGVVYRYNQIRGVTSRGVLLRAHDGVDLPVANGTRVLAPFAGVVVDPATIWKPWDPQRYGTVVVVRSTETASRGYLALMAHLSRRDVRVGDRVRRGVVVGRTGQTGNAGGTPPHLHFELRAPFTIPYAYAGVRRSLDVFDPLPSLHEADPKRT